MSKTKYNIPKSKRIDCQLWGKRPMTNSDCCSENKRICRRIERKRRKRLVIEILKRWWDDEAKI